MPETTAGSTTPEKIERPSFGDIYAELNGFDDEAVALHMGYDLESLFEGLNDGSLSPAESIQAIRACEFLRLRKEYTAQGTPNPDALAAQVAKEMTRREITPISVAYYAVSLPSSEGQDEQDEQDALEGKDSPRSETSAEPNDETDPESTPPASETDD